MRFVLKRNKLIIFGQNAIEKNKFNPSVILALKMAKLFSLTVEELFIIEEE